MTLFADEDHITFLAVVALELIYTINIILSSNRGHFLMCYGQSSQSTQTRLLSSLFCKTKTTTLSPIRYDISRV